MLLKVLLDGGVILLSSGEVARLEIRSKLLEGGA